MLGADHSASPSTSCGSSPRTSAAASAASCRSRPRRSSRSLRRAQARQAGQVDRVPLASRCWPPTTAATRSRTSTIAAKRDGTVTGLDVRPARRHGRLPAAGHAGRPDPRRVHVQRDLQVPGATGSPARACSPPRRPTDAYRGAGRPEATFAIERIMDELAVELGMDPMELREQNWIKHEEFPFTTVARADLRLAATTRRPPTKAMELFGYDELRGEQAGAPRAQATRCSSASASRRSPRCAGWPRRGCSARWPTAPAAGRHASIRMLPTGKVEVVTGAVRARPGPRDGVEPDRRRPARRAVRGRRGAARRHPGLAARAWTPTARGRWPSAASPSSRPREKVVAQGQARSPRTCSRRPRTTSSSPTARSRSRAHRTRA